PPHAGRLEEAGIRFTHARPLACPRHPMSSVTKRYPNALPCVSKTERTAGSRRRAKSSGGAAIHTILPSTRTRYGGSPSDLNTGAQAAEGSASGEGGTGSSGFMTRDSTTKLWQAESYQHGGLTRTWAVSRL